MNNEEKIMAKLLQDFIENHAREGFFIATALAQMNPIKTLKTIKNYIRTLKRLRNILEKELK